MCVSVCVCVCLYVCVVVCVYIRKHHDALVYAYFIVCVLTTNTKRLPGGGSCGGQS